MKKSSRVILSGVCVGTCVLLASMSLLLPAAAQAQFTYTNVGVTITITGYTGPGGAVTTPDTINGLPVTGIGRFAFRYQTSLTSITMGINVKNIGDYAFNTCTGLTSLTIPNSVTNLGQDAFSWCSSLTNVMIGNREIGTSSRKDVTVIGDVVNTAARIESSTEPMRMSISEATYARLRDPRHFRQSNTLQVKNRTAPVKVYVSESAGE